MTKKEIRELQTLCRKCRMSLTTHSRYSRDNGEHFYVCRRSPNGGAKIFEPLTNLEIVELCAKKRKYFKEDIMMLSSCGFSNLQIVEYITDYP